MTILKNSNYEKDTSISKNFEREAEIRWTENKKHFQSVNLTKKLITSKTIT